MFFYEVKEKWINLQSRTVLNIIREFVPQDASISVADSEKYIYYQPSKQVDLGIKLGDLISEKKNSYL